MKTEVALKTGTQGKKNSFVSVIKKDFARYKITYFMAIPVLAFYIIFHYVPMYGVIMAFKNFNPRVGIIHSPWAGLKYFHDFFISPYAFRIIKNTILINVYDLFWGFPAPIILALLINEIKKTWFKRAVQTLTYMPHFISLVVVCGMIIEFTQTNGVINDLISAIGFQRQNLLTKSEMFRSIYIASGIWQGIGWGSIIFLAALSGINPSLYEAAEIDGANRWKQTLHVTLPGIAPTIIILLILRLGNMMNVGFEKIILLYNPLTYETSDVISSFVYRKGLGEFNYSYGAAVGLFNSIINFILLLFANKISRKLSETSLW